MTEPFIETYSGIKFNFLSPRPEDICIEDIAHSLSQQCRFTGHCKIPMTIAAHSINVASLVPDESKLAALLHDSAEAYLGDISRPIKKQFPQIVEIENRLLDSIFEKFNVTGFTWADVKIADDYMLALEGRKLMHNVDGWADKVQPKDMGAVKTMLSTTFIAFKSAAIEYVFLKYFEKYSALLTK